MKLKTILGYCFLTLFTISAHAQHAAEFIENKGQWGSWFNYKVSLPSAEVCLEQDGFRFILSDADNNHKADYYHHGQTQIKPILKFHTYKVTFVGADVPQIKGENPQKVYYNYFLGNDPARWKSEIHPCRAVNYYNLYKGIGAHIFSQKDNLEYEFIVDPGADASQVKLKFEGQDAITIRNHELQLTTSVGKVTELRPYVYQYVNDEQVTVACEYKLRGNILTFEFPEGYDHSKPLIIDPVVVLCTLSGSTADNWGYSATYDDAGNFYAGGLVNTIDFGGTFPVSPGAFQVTFGGGYTAPGNIAYAADISIIKYDATLKNRIYATYLGGLQNDHVHSMIVDPAGNLIIAGRTLSANFPVTPGAYQTTNKGWWDMVVTKFNSTGTALIGSTYIGGSKSDGVNYDSTEYVYGELKYNYGDDSRSEVQIDKAGEILVTACTISGDFPTTPTAISTTLSGLQDGVVFKFNPTLTSLLWSTYIGGTGSDAGYVLAFDTLQNFVYVAGGTNSPNFPTTPGTIHPSFVGGSADGFILKFQNGGSYPLVKGTYIGASAYDQVYGIQVSSTTNQVYAMGQTLGGGFPVTGGVYVNAGSSQFVMTLDENLATNLASTVFGSKTSAFTNISPVAFLVDTCDNVYISGWGGNLGISGVASGDCNGMPTTTDGYQLTTDGRDFYFIVLGKGLATLRYASYYGRSCTAPSEQWMNEHVDGGTSRFDRHGIIYQGVCASCGGAPTVPGSCASPFPTTKGVWSELDASRNCNEAALKVAFNIGPVSADVTAGPTTSGCAPLKVDFTNMSNNALTYFWDFGDGGTSTTFSPSHTFVTAGTFTVTLSAANSNACFKTNDTFRLLIHVDTNIITPDFTYILKDSCNPYVASFTNTSTDHVGTPTFEWHFGDGTNYTGTTPPDHNYPDTGTYKVMLVMNEPLACKSPDTVIKTLSMHNFKVSGSFQSPDTLCLGSTFSPEVTATNATGYRWTMGDSVINGKVFSYKFPKVGTYTLTLTVSNSGACNGSVSQTRTLTVIDGPLADFTYGPIPPVANVPVSFTNQSVRALTYLWEFGDDQTSNEVNPIHQYNKTGTYSACLNAYNKSTCPSKICKDVSTEVVPILGLPTAFSPNGDGVNDVLYVRGAAIKTLDLKIFNRWGQLIFETNSKEIGWDGTFNGKPQPIEAYAFVLNAGFIDGTAKTMKGNITLLR